MRSAILIFATLALIGGGFFVYTLFEPGPSKKPTRALGPIARQQRPAATQSLRGFAPGESVWVKRYDQKTGELSSQFKGERYTPREDNTVDVEKPQAEFFSNDGRQRIKVEGVTGNVVMNLSPEDKPGKVQSRMEAEAPSRGKLQDVVISMFEPADAEEPNLVATMNNAAFDNDTFRIATEAYVDEKGNRVEADQVPVMVRGKDYDFDGKGLVIRWNERDRKLQLLEIAHGQSLTVKNPSALSKPEFLTAPATQPTADSAMLALASVDPHAFVLAAAAPNKKAPVKRRPARRPATSPLPRPPATAATHPKVTRDESPVVYRASFERDVRIFEADKQIIVGDQMHIDMLQESNQDSATTKPAEKSAAPASKPVAKGKHRNDNFDEVATSQPASEQAPTTQPAQGPITVKWSGKLRVVPLDGPPDAHLVPGKAAVRIVGSPVVLTREGTEAHCGSAFYNSADQSASLLSSPAVPIVTMTDSRGAKVTTPRLDYVAPQEGSTRRVARLIGPSRAEIPVEDESGAKPQPVVATWNDDCRLQLVQLGTDKAAIEQANLRGAVKVDSPQLAMSSEGLALRFDPTGKPKHATTMATSAPAATAPTTSPADNPASTLREIIATGGVKARITDAQQKLQSIDAETLRVKTETDTAGRTYAKELQADGKVRTSQDGRTLDAEHLFAELAPTTRPAATQHAASMPATQSAATRPANPFGGDANVRLVSLLARDNVKLTSPDGGSASADSLAVESHEGKEVYHLLGKPTATVSNGKTTITGPEIRMLPQEKLASIVGPGTLHGRQPDDPKQTVDIAWAGGANVDGARDLINVSEKVQLRSTQADGTVNGATSDKLAAKLAPRPPSTRPTTVATSGPATKPSQPDPMNFLADKEITTAILSGNVEVKSELLAPGGGGELARGLNLFAQTVTYDRVTGRMEVPVEGRMLYQDHRAPQPQKKDQAAPEGPTIGSGRGATAFQWSKSLLYDQQQQHATMTGDVQVVHRPDANGGRPFELRGEVLTAFLEPDPAAAAAKPAAKTATKPNDPADDATIKFRLKRVTVRDRVHVTSSNLTFDAHELVYDPLAQLLTASGDEANPVVVYDNKNGTTTTAGTLEWNTRTDQFKVSKLTGKVRR